MVEWNPRANEIFFDALEHEEGRQTFLDGACGNDSTLRQNVEEMLAAHNRAGNFLDDPAQPTLCVADSNTPSSLAGRFSTPEVRGSRLGRYQLIEKLGEGGFGAVWLAEQTEPIHRQVAIKIIRWGMESASMLARFEQERQALALMDHPNIARVLDAGTLDIESQAANELARPYFVMEVVKGVPITYYCDQARLTIRERLELFIPVCQAVQHAHQKGIIHRDLKPSNVLVALHDGKPIVKVIDFGVAKATGPKLTDQTLNTEVGQIIGTLEYMAPEQAEFKNTDIDTRADIYSLGVMLFELLTGTLPFLSADYQNLEWDAFLRAVREVDPPRPSAKVLKLPDLAEIAMQRKVEPRRLAHILWGDLDWVLLKCLAKERGRRYETANGLATELAKYLANEPVAAGPPSRGYRLKKFVRRHRGVVVAASLVLLALVAGTVGTTVGLVRANEQKRIAQDSELKATIAAKAESAARQVAQKRLAQIEKVNEVLSSVFGNLDPDESERKVLPLTARIAERLDRAAAVLQDDAMGDELTAAHLKQTIGRSYAWTGNGTKAIPLLLQARETISAFKGPDDAEVLDCSEDLAGAYSVLGRQKEAVALYEEIEAKKKKELGPDHKDTLRSSFNLANALCLTYRDERAIKLHEHILERRRAILGPDHRDTLSSEVHLAKAYRLVGNWAKALPIYEEALPKIKKSLGPKHVDTVDTMHNLAFTYEALGEWQKSLPLLEDALVKNQLEWGPHHYRTFFSAANVAWAKLQSGKSKDGLPMLKDVLEECKERLGPDHTQTLYTMNLLGRAYNKVGEPAKAIPVFQQALAKRRVILGPTDADTLGTLNNLAQSYRFTGQSREALVLYREALDQLEPTLGPNHFQTLATAFNLGLAYKETNQPTQAVALLEKTLSKSKVVPGPHHRLTIEITETLANLYETGQNYAKAEQAWSDLVGASEATRGGDHRLTIAARVQVASMCLLEHKYVPAEKELRICLEWRQRVEPDRWPTWNTKSLLGEALCGQGKYEAAEPLLLDGYKGMKQRGRKIPPIAAARLPEAAQRLVDLYKASKQPEKAARWTKTLQKEQGLVAAKAVIGLVI